MPNSSWLVIALVATATPSFADPSGPPGDVQLSAAPQGIVDTTSAPQELELRGRHQRIAGIVFSAVGLASVGGMVWAHGLTGSDAGSARGAYYALFGATALAGFGAGIPLWIIGQGNIDDAAAMRARPQLSVGALAPHAYGVALSATF